MKLKNKKTGEIVNAMEVDLYTDAVYLKISKDGRYDSRGYGSLAELNAEWEDYEENEYYYAITSIKADDGITKMKNKHNDMTAFDKSIGNYFETREEAEKAVEKLKALERLQKKFNFHITGWDVVDTQVIITTDCDFDYVKDRQDDGLWSDLDLVFNGNLLFGGEE